MGAWDTKERLARALRAARLSRRMTPAEVARALGLHRPAVSEIEAGRRSVMSEELYELSRLFSVPASELLSRGEKALDRGGGRSASEAAPALEARILEMARIIVDQFHPERVILGAGPGGPMDAVAFHAQQCAEKYLKALMCFRGDDVPRIHDVDALLSRTGLWDRLEIEAEESRLLTDYATITRHPGDYEPVTHAEAAYAVELAERVQAAVRIEMPGYVLERG